MIRVDWYFENMRFGVGEVSCSVAVTVSLNTGVHFVLTGSLMPSVICQDFQSHLRNTRLTSTLLIASMFRRPALIPTYQGNTSAQNEKEKKKSKEKKEGNEKKRMLNVSI